uniref:FCF1 n=1 Tax=Cricetulus griseus TaxID=10029 RepID=A0A8C2LAD1_CRIGR
MGKQKKTRKYATMRQMLSLRDERLKEKDRLKPKKKEKKDPSALKEREVPQHPSCLFFQYNTQLGPPYHLLVDTNFINFSIKAKLDLVQSMMDCLYAKCIPCITDCVMAETEKLGQKYRVSLRIAYDLTDCSAHTKEPMLMTAWYRESLKESIQKIPGVPIMYISNHRYNIERMPVIMERLDSNPYSIKFTCLSLPAFSVVS